MMMKVEKMYTNKTQINSNLEQTDLKMNVY